MVHVITLMVGFLLLLWVNRNQWFSADEWDFLTDRGFGPGNRGFFEPHTQHWSTIPILVYRALFSLAGLRTYMPYVAVLLILHLGVAHLLWRVMRGSGVDPWIATGSCAMFLVFAAGSGNILWPFQIGFVGSLLFGLGHVLLVDHGEPFGRRDVVGWVLSLIGLMFSGIAVPMTAAAGVVSLIRRGWRAMILTVTPAAAVYLVWLATAGKASLSGHLAPIGEALVRLPVYVSIGVRASIEGILTAELALPPFIPIVFMLGALALMRGRSSSAALVGCAVGCVLIFAVTGIGRVSRFGVDQAEQSRYVYVAAALLLPLVALGLTVIATRGRLAWIAVLFFVVAGVVTNFRILHQRAEDRAEQSQFIRDVILAAAVPSAFQGPLLTHTPVPQPELLTFGLQLDELVSMRVDGALPPVESISATAQLQAAAGLQVALSPQPRVVSGRQPAVLEMSGTAEPAGGTCFSFELDPTGQRPTAVVNVDEPVSLMIRSEAGGELEVVMSQDGTVTPFPRVFNFSEGRTSFLNIGIPKSQAIVALPHIGETVVCNLRLP